MSSHTVLTYSLSLCTWCSHTETAPRDRIYLDVLSFFGDVRKMILHLDHHVAQQGLWMSICVALSEAASLRSTSCQGYQQEVCMIYIVRELFHLSGSCDLPVTDGHQRAKHLLNKTSFGLSSTLRGQTAPLPNGMVLILTY